MAGFLIDWNDDAAVDLLTFVYRVFRQVLGKSVKPIPVMVLGVVVAGKRYSLAKCVFVLLIVIGVSLFMYKDDRADDGGSDRFGLGEILLVSDISVIAVFAGKLRPLLLGSLPLSPPPQLLLHHYPVTSPDFTAVTGVSNVTDISLTGVQW